MQTRMEAIGMIVRKEEVGRGVRVSESAGEWEGGRCRKRRAEQGRESEGSRNRERGARGKEESKSRRQSRGIARRRNMRGRGEKRGVARAYSRNWLSLTTSGVRAVSERAIGTQSVASVNTSFLPGNKRKGDVLGSETHSRSLPQT